MTHQLKKFLIIFRHRYFTAMGLLTLLTILSVTQARFTRKTFYKNNNPDFLSRSEARFAAARQLLPGRGFIGYVAPNKNSKAASERYLRAQYALAPLVLQRKGLGGSLVLADFESPHELLELFSILDLETQADMGDGLKLLRRRE
jgi:hypothetical protein